MFLFLASALAAEPTLVFYDEAPTTLNPLYPAGPADERAQELLFDRLFFRGPIA